jgi:hypothetical protein
MAVVAGSDSVKPNAVPRVAVAILGVARLPRRKRRWAMLSSVMTGRREREDRQGSGEGGAEWSAEPALDPNVPSVPASWCA